MLVIGVGIFLTGKRAKAGEKNAFIQQIHFYSICNLCAFLVLDIFNKK